jgi:LysM repeat protein
MRKLLLGLLLGCAAHAAAAPEELQTVVVRPGDTLWSISQTYLKDPTKWNQILRYNKLTAADPSIALPGMSLKIPVNLIKEQYRAARLTNLINEVLLRRTGTETWGDAKLSMDLFKNDTLRTKADSRADVRFYSGETLSLYANSIAVLRPPKHKDTDVELMAGEMRGLRSRVVTASARITPKTKDTEFGARVKDDLTTLVQVYKGKADVEAQGKTVEVQEGFASEVKLDLPPSKPVELPPLAEFADASATSLGVGQTSLSMENGIVSLNLRRGGGIASANVKGDLKNVGTGNINDKALVENEALKMISVANPVQGYHLQLAKDQNFTQLVIDENFDAFDKIELRKLVPPGTYWMRVALVDLLGFEGKFNTPRLVTVTGRKGR